MNEEKLIMLSVFILKRSSSTSIVVYGSLKILLAMES